MAHGKNAVAVARTLEELVLAGAPSSPALSMRQGKRWLHLTRGELLRRSAALSGYLVEQGLRVGDRVAILAESRPEWVVSLLAINRSGAIAVPLDPKLSEEELARLVADARPTWLFASRATAEVARTLRARNGTISIALIDGAAGDLAGIDSLQPSAPLPPRPLPPGSAAVITYTSGTSGEPKGVMTTLENLAHQVAALGKLHRLGRRDVFLSMLGLNHLLELTGGLLLPLSRGARVVHANTLFPNELLELFQETRATHMVTVPLFLRAVQAGLERELERAGRWKRAAFAAAFAIAGVLPFRAVKQLLFLPVHRRFGLRLRGFVVGGAPLSPEVEAFFERLGLSVHQGYGLSETSPVTTYNAPGRRRSGSVGRPLPGVEVSIGCGGEILIRGPHLMRGYFQRPDLTDAQIDGAGWFHTGDVGSLDRDGFLYITGRIKNLIALPSGKKVQPEEVEVAVGRSPWFQEVCVLGRAAGGGGEEVCAVVVPTVETCRRLVGDPQGMEQEVRLEVARACAELAPFKRPARVVIREEELPKTSTRKVKRQRVHGWLDGAEARFQELA